MVVSVDRKATPEHKEQSVKDFMMRLATTDVFFATIPGLKGRGPQLISNGSAPISA